MSLRRSARVQTRSVADAPQSLNGVPPTDSQPAKSGSRSKKRKQAEDLVVVNGKETVITNGAHDNDFPSDAMRPPLTTPIKRRKATEPQPRIPAIALTTPIRNSVTSETTSPDEQATNPSTLQLTPHPLPRRTSAHRTNATLVTPGGTQHIAPPLNESPSKPAPLVPASSSTTTQTILARACAHLISVDPSLAPLIAAHPCSVFSPTGLAEPIDPFRELTSGIISQQVSGAAASSIKAKFIALFTPPTPFPTPLQVSQTPIPLLRTAGLSQRKAEYIQGLAEKFAQNELTIPMLMNGSDEDVMEHLIAVRGLGVWSVQMFMCFGLKRMDVFATGDLGVQRGMAAYKGRDVKKLKAKGGEGGGKGGGKWKYMSEKEMLEISEPFRPYRSLFMWYMWRIEDVDVSAMQGS